MPVKSLLHCVFSLITWNTKPWSKQLAECNQQVVFNYVRISWRTFTTDDSGWVPPYQFINAEITSCCNFWQMYKNYSEIAAHKKRLWSKVSPNKTFFPFPPLVTVFNLREGSFSETVFLYFTKIVATIHFSVETVFLRRALGAINCVYTMYFKGADCSRLNPGWSFMVTCLNICQTCLPCPPSG